MATLKNIYYHIANNTFTVDDQFEGESDVTLLTIDFTGSGVDDWTKWVDFRLYDGTGIPTSLGLGNLHTYTMPISLMRRGRLEIQPYAISGTNEVTKFAIKQVVINRSLSVVQDDVAYDPSIIADIQADLAHLDGTKMETDGSNSDIVELAFRNGGTLVYDLNRQVMRIVATDGTELNIGGETWYEEGKATEAIANGAPVQFAGSFGDNYLVKNAVPAEINADPSLFMGLSTKNTLADEWVKITHFGLVHDFNTNGWAMGTILWFDSINGGLTATKPSIPNAQIEVCAVVKTSETVGSVLVRPHFLQDCYTQAEVDALLSGKQPNLVSGVNIKTVNGMNIVGSGNVVIPVVDGIDGQDGVDGLSAYEVAVANGFIGTEAEWLLSLNGADGLDGADAIAGKLPSQYDELPAPVGTVSAVLEDVPGMMITIHLDEPVELAMMSSMELQTQSGSSASTIEVAFNIDGVDHDPLQRLLSGSNDLGIGALVHRSEELPAGDHIVKLRFRRVSGTSTPGINKAHMLVMGMQGAKGIDGDDGVGVVAGGTTNQVLAKTSATNFDTYWMDVYNKSEADTLFIAKVDKVAGKSLVSDTLITDLSDGGNSDAHTHKVIVNDTFINNAIISAGVNGSSISRNIADANPALTINQQNASSSGVILDLQTGGVRRASVSGTGGEGFFNGSGIKNISSASNAQVATPTTGTKISRNIADANPALIVNQANASSTGDILKAQLAGADKFYVTKDGTSWTASSFVSGGGYFYGTNLVNNSSANNANVWVDTVGTQIRRNVADSNTTLVVNQANASSTGNILDFQFAGVSKASVDKDGKLSTASQSLVTNLNADLHDGYHAGNASGNIPVSSGNLNTNLNADMLDGVHLLGSGGVIDSGSNANGYYVKFADGTLSCSLSLVSSSSANTTWTYPVAFYSAPTLSGCAEGATLQPLIFQIYSKSTTSCDLNTLSTSSTRVASVAHVTAIGRWKA